MRQYSGGEKEESSGRRGVGQSDSCVPSARSSPRCNQLIADSLEGLVFPPLAPLTFPGRRQRRESS